MSDLKSPQWLGGNYVPEVQMAISSYKLNHVQIVNAREKETPGWRDSFEAECYRLYFLLALGIWADAQNHRQVEWRMRSWLGQAQGAYKEHIRNMLSKQNGFR